MNSNESKSEVTQGPNLNVTPHPELANKHLSPLAQEKLAIKSDKEVVSEVGGLKTYTAVYLAARVSSDNIEEGVKNLSEVLNTLAADGYIHSCLAPISSLGLHVSDGNPMSVVVCFPLVPTESIDEVKSIANKILWSSGVYFTS